MIRIYFNLHKHQFSIQEKINNSWRVTGYSSDIILKNVKYKVYESGRQRVLKEKRKNVHAYILGEEVDCLPKSFIKLIGEAYYNPYEVKAFVNYLAQELNEDDFVRLVVVNNKGRVLRYKNLIKK